jgi:hypothetical protein
MAIGVGSLGVGGVLFVVRDVPELYPANAAAKATTTRHIAKVIIFIV